MANRKKRPSIAYWEQRAIDREAAYQAGSHKTIAEVQAAYDRAFEAIEQEIQKVEKQLAKRGGYAAPDAQAYLARTNRLAKLQDDIWVELNQAAAIEKRATTARYISAMKEGYYRTVFDIQQGIGFAYSFNILPSRAIQAALNANWLNHNYSKSIWKNVQKASFAAEDIVTRGLMTGASIQAMTAELAHLMEVKKKDAERLIRTETNYFSNQGELAAYAESGIKKYRYVATLDNRTSKLCQERDGRIYLVSEATVGENYPPMHAWCRSTTIALIIGETYDGLERRARDPHTGKTYLVPADMTYREWEQQHVTPRILTDDEKYAINQYISAGSYTLNERLRNGTELTDAEKKMITNLDSALLKLPVYEGLASRSVTLDGERLEKFLKEHEEGESITYLQYSSFTSGKVYNADANIRLWVNSTDAKDISGYNPGEKEILYSRNARFRINNVEKTPDGITHILLEEVR